MCQLRDELGDVVHRHMARRRVAPLPKIITLRHAQSNRATGPSHISWYMSGRTIVSRAASLAAGLRAELGGRERCARARLAVEVRSRDEDEAPSLPHECAARSLHEPETAKLADVLALHRTDAVVDVVVERPARVGDL